tara:strand:- start:1003 stop:1503 length:501 start_codon:yes stop_codon:yes gene_type:complete
MIVIGIDPGKSGGVVVINDCENTNDLPMAEMHKCPPSPVDMASILRNARNTAWVQQDKIVVAIEKVWAFPTDARSAAFKFGVNYGMWLGIIGSLDLPFMEIPPKTWMKSYAPVPKDKKERKQYLKDTCITMYKDIFLYDKNVTYAVSDAALIALWCIERKNDENHR